MPLTASMPRVVVDELMDQPGIDPEEHRRALAGLRRINAISQTGRHMTLPILDMARRSCIDKLSILDVACGGAEVSIEIARRLANRNITTSLNLLDKSPTALAEAQTRALDARIESNVIVQDLHETSLPAKSADVVISTLFLHHLANEALVVDLMRQMRNAARRLVVISDLERSCMGLAAAWVGCRILSRSPIVHFDGPASVRAAWTQSELLNMAEKAGMTGAKLTSVWPWRTLLVWEHES
jgi:2-polyprenyl-3-methyl-5-hydroxy-6-metoxy-1,4-benzoquinol methylase